MSHSPALRFVLPCCLLAASLPSCQLSKLKFQNSTSTAASDPSKRTPPTATAPDNTISSQNRSAEETAFLEKCAILGQSSPTLAGRDGYHFSSTELQRLAQLTDPNLPSIRAAIAAITDYRNQLKNNGIELIFVPVPPKAILFPDKLAKDLKIKGKKPARLDSTLQATYATLRAKGVRVIDPTDTLLAERESKKDGPLYPKTAPVWSPRAAAATAALIASELKGAKWSNQPGPEGPFISESSLLSYTGTLTTGTPIAETLALRNIGRSTNGKMRSVTFSTGGHPLALMGDSTLLAWRETNNPANSSPAFASLADQLAFEFQTTPDLFPGKTDGRNAPRQRLLRDATNGKNPLSSTKVLLWVISATDLALNDWKRLPLRLQYKLSAPPLMLEVPVTLIPDASSRPPAIAPFSTSPAAPSPDPTTPALPR